MRPELRGKICWVLIVLALTEITTLMLILKFWLLPAEIFVNTNEEADQRARETARIGVSHKPYQTKIKNKETEIAETDAVLNFTFAGDVMLGRYVGYKYQNDFSQLFSKMDNSIFADRDISWVNLEGPISEQTVGQSTEPDDLNFLFSKTAVDALQFLNINTVGLANNHTLNAGEAGLITTQQLLTANQINWHGHPQVINDTSIKKFTHDDVRVALIAVNALPLRSTEQKITQLISQEDVAGNFVIVLPHWGVEYQTTHAPQQELFAHQWIDAGADLIVGSHPHVIQDAEIYRSRLIFYSLGNFIFDQTFSKQTQQGLIITGEISTSKLKLVFVPIESVNLQPTILQGEPKGTIIKNLCAPLENSCQGDVITLEYSQ